MVDTAMAGFPARPAVRYAIERLREPARIRAWLEPERAYAAYALGQLEPSLFRRSRWWTATGPAKRALLAMSRDGLGPALFTLGDPEPLEALLSLHPGPRYAFATFRPEHLAVVQRYHVLERRELMVRMSVTAETFRPVPGEALRLSSGQVRRLWGEDGLQVNRLYSAEGVPAFYLPRYLEEGVYYGVFVEGRLAAIAGTHVVSPSERVAVVGNVFTHPQYRNRGLATVATSAVTEALLPVCSLVVLTVGSTNAPALRVYEKLGYQQVCNILETLVKRRESRALLAPWRRLLARWLGRRQGREMVVR